MEKVGLIGNVIEELKKITWPTKQEATKLTVVVLTISLIVGAYLGIIDILLAKVLESLTKIK
jgi:preprotein translocase subunit SecE